MNDKYRGLLREALADLEVTVETVLLDDLEQRGDAILDELEPIGCLVSLVGTFADLRRLAGHRGTILFRPRARPDRRDAAAAHGFTARRRDWSGGRGALSAQRARRAAAVPRH